MAIQKAEAFVLKTQPFRSSSLIITFFTKPFGKLKGIAKGVRREREVRGALFELFTHLEIVFYEKIRSELHLVSEASMLDSHDTLRMNLESVTYASYFSELTDCLSEVHDPHEGIFNLLAFSYKFLPSVPPEKLSRLFEIKLLREIGWIPYVEGCIECQKQDMAKGFFSIRQGALYCAECARSEQDARPLSPEALAALRYFAEQPLEQAIKFRVLPHTEKELSQLIGQFLQYRLGTPLQTRRFLDKIKPVLNLSK